MNISPKTVYHNLRLLDRVDIVTSAIYRQQAVEALADPDLSPVWQQAIANRLYQANRLLTRQSVTTEDSY
jgi:hypothetical protein